MNCKQVILNINCMMTCHVISINNNNNLSLSCDNKILLSSINEGISSSKGIHRRSDSAAVSNDLAVLTDQRCLKLNYCYLRKENLPLTG